MPGNSATPFIIGFLTAALIAAITVIVIMATNGDGGEATARVEPTVAATATAAPTAAPTVAPTQAPAVSEPAPPPEPTPRSCAVIRADGNYASELEREFFLNNCQPTPAPASAPLPQQAAAPAPPPPPGPSGPTAEEQAYINRATNATVFFLGRFGQYFGQPSMGALYDIYELATVCRNFANELNSIRPVPQRFQAVHDDLIFRAVAFSDILFAVTNNVGSLQQFIAWLAEYERRLDAFDAALGRFFEVTGIELPTLRAL